MLRARDILKATVVAEVMAKESMVLTAYLGKLPNYKGMGYFVVESIKNKHIEAVFSLLLCSVVGFILLGISYVWVLVAQGISVMILKVYVNNTLESVTGDVMGASNEINRMITLIIILAFSV